MLAVSELVKGENTGAAFLIVIGQSHRRRLGGRFIRQRNIDQTLGTIRQPHAGASCAGLKRRFRVGRKSGGGV